jgi:hypothetical protein
MLQYLCLIISRDRLYDFKFGHIRYAFKLIVMQEINNIVDETKVLSNICYITINLKAQWGFQTLKLSLLINPLKTKSVLQTQSVPRSKHFSSRL